MGQHKMKVTRSILKQLILETMDEGSSTGTSTEKVGDPRAKLVLDAAAAVHLAMKKVDTTEAVKKLGALQEPFRKAAYAESGTPTLRDGDAFASVAQWVANEASDVVALAGLIQDLKDTSFDAHNDLIKSEKDPEAGSIEALEMDDY